MPHIDLEAIIARAGSGGDGRRVACETILNADAYPPDSISLSKEEAIHDWFDRTSNVYYDRNESTKANTSTHSNPTSQRFGFRSGSKSSKPSIIGLPKQPQTATCSRRPVKPGKTGFFPKRLGSAGKYSIRSNEPSSPKVSCMGRVRSRNRNRCRSSSKNSTTTTQQKSGFWGSLTKMFRVGCRKNRPVDRDGQSGKAESKSKQPSEPKVDPVSPPGLGGMNRFVSGRRSDAWAGDALDAGGDLESPSTRAV